MAGERERSRANNPMFYKSLIFILLLATWLIFSGLFDGFHTTLGVISIALVMWMSADFLFLHRERSERNRLTEVTRLCGYLVWLFWQIILSNIAILKIALAPRGLKKVQPSIVKFKTGLKTDFEKFLLANSITLTPGTVTLKILDDTFYVHAIGDEAAEGLDGEMERRIRHCFEHNYHVEMEATADA